MTAPATEASPRIKVIHVVYKLTPGTFTGGVAKMVYELAAAQRKQGVDVTVWTVGSQSDEVDQDGVTVRTFEGQRRLGVASSHALTSELRALAEAQGSALIVHAHNTFHPLNRDVFKAVTGTRARLFYSPHGALDPRMMRGYGFKALKKRAYVRLVELKHLNAAHGVFALTPKEQAQLELMSLHAPIHVIPNGIAAISPPAEDRAPGRGTSLGFIGRINPKKGLHHLIRALHRLRDTQPDATLTIAGNRSQFPTYVQDLDALAEELGLTSALHWTGFLDESAKRDLLRDIDIFLHASDSEGMPMAVLEAMEAGVPCVLTPGCYMQHAAQENAVLEVQQSPDALAAALAHLISAPQDRHSLGVRGQHHARRVHAWPMIAASYMETYTDSSS